MLRRPGVGRRRWGNGQGEAGPVWPPQANVPVEQPVMVRVERQVHEVIEAVGTPEQIARSGVTRPAHQASNEVGPPAGELPAGTGRGGLLVDALKILWAIELWLVLLVRGVLTVGANHPRLVVWAGGFWLLSLAVS